MLLLLLLLLLLLAAAAISGSAAHQTVTSSDYQQNVSVGNCTLELLSTDDCNPTTAICRRHWHGIGAVWIGRPRRTV